MRRSTRSLLAGFAVLSTAGLAVVAEAAPDSVIDFEALQPGEQVTTQFPNVRFDRFPSGVAADPPTIEQVAAGRAQSGVKVARTFREEGEFVFDDMNGAFTTFSRRKVRLHAGTLNGGEVKLIAYNPSGQQLDAVTANTPTGGDIKTPLEITRPQSEIAFFRVEGAYAIDDFSYDVPDTPPPPDFGIARDLTGVIDPSGEVGLEPGGSFVNVRIVVNRFNGASGPLKFSAAGLPPGVTGVFLPASETSLPSVILRLTAAKSANGVTNRTVTVTADPVNKPQGGPAARSLTFTLNVFEQYDLEVQGIEVTQGIQRQLQPCESESICTIRPSLERGDADPGSPVGYQGVRMVRNKKTVARVFGAVESPAGQKVSGVGMMLHGSRGGNPLPGSPLQTTGGELTLKWDILSYVTLDERVGKKGVYTFTLPPSWTDAGTINLRAQLIEPLAFVGAGQTECATSECRANNNFRLNGIPFVDTGYVELSLVGMYASPQTYSSLPCSSEVFDRAEQLSPLPDGNLVYGRCGYEGAVDITDIKNEYDLSDPDDNDDANEDVHDLVVDWADEHPSCKRRNCSDYVIGVNTGVARGRNCGELPDGDEPIGVVEFKRPLTSVAHEMFHGFGRDHASDCTPDPENNDPGDTEDWPPDQRGYIQGIGYDVDNGRVIAPRALSGVGSTDSGASDFNPDQWYDFMSYCTAFINPDLDSWIGVLDWERTIDDLRTFSKERGRIPAAAARAGAAQRQATLLVRGSFSKGVTRLTQVKPATGPVSPAPAADTRFLLLARNAGGQELSRVAMKEVKSPSQFVQDALILSAQVPAADVQSLEIVNAQGAVLAQRSRSAGLPRVRVLSPRRGQRVGRGRFVSVRWRSSDPDSPERLARVELSLNGGRSWQSAWTGPDSGRANVPAESFPFSRRARVRVRVNDGFNEAAARSARFVSLGSRPSVRILAPAARPRLRIKADSPLYLSAQALDDRFEPITSRRRVAWFDGRRRIARGPVTSVTGLRPGVRLLRVVARDSRGRTGSASVRVRVLKAPPRFIRLGVPSLLPRGARRLRMRLSATIPSALRVRGKGVSGGSTRLGRRTRTVTLRVPRSRRPLRLRLTLTGGGARTTIPVTVARP